MTGLIIATHREAVPFLRPVGMTALCNYDGPVLLDLRPAWTMVICICGMGPVAARNGAGLLFEKFSVKRVVNAGAAGYLATNAEIGDLFLVSGAMMWPKSEVVHPCGTDRWTDLRTAVLATVARPVFGKKRRADIAQKAELVDMEGAAIARVCLDKKIPFYAVKGISDMAQEHDKASLLANLDAVCEKLAAKVWSGLYPEPHAGNIHSRKSVVCRQWV